jgi:hypothetical protein
MTHSETNPGHTFVEGFAWEKPERRGESQKREWVCPLSWSVHYNLVGEGYIESICCCVQARFLGMETKNSFPNDRYLYRSFIHQAKDVVIGFVVL